MLNLIFLLNKKEFILIKLDYITFDNSIQNIFWLLLENMLKRNKII